MLPPIAKQAEVKFCQSELCQLEGLLLAQSCPSKKSDLITSMTQLLLAKVYRIDWPLSHLVAHFKIVKGKVHPHQECLQ